MKRTTITSWLVLTAVLTGGVGALAQSSRGIPGPDEYEKFSSFITDRNIFDPNRQPHNYGVRSTYHRHTPTPRGTPGIQLVGTMSYEKGYFAFFSGNNEDLSKVLKVGDKMEEYTVTHVTANFVGLESADKKEQIELTIGDGFRQESGKWVFSKAGELPAPASAPDTTSSSSTSNSSSNENTSSTPAQPPSATEQNDILKRLMQQREKESQ
jgi:hypothetical protein